MRTRLAKRKIASQHGETHCTKCLCETRQQGRLAIGSRAVSQNETIAIRSCRTMKKALHRDFLIGSINEFFNRGHQYLNPQGECIPQINERMARASRTEAKHRHMAQRT